MGCRIAGQVVFAVRSYHPVSKTCSPQKLAHHQDNVQASGWRKKIRHSLVYDKQNAKVLLEQLLLQHEITLFRSQRYNA